MECDVSGEPLLRWGELVAGSVQECVEGCDNSGFPRDVAILYRMLQDHRLDHYASFE